MVKSDAENVMEAEIIGLILGSSLCDKVEFALCFRICGGSWQVGDEHMRSSQSYLLG
jgi:hypothetical protein